MPTTQNNNSTELLLLGRFAHDLTTPLASLGMLVESLAEPDLQPGHLNRALLHMRKALDRAREIAQEAQDLAMGIDDRTNFLVSNVLALAVSSYQTSTKFAPGVITVQVESDFEVNGPKRLFIRAVDNLLKNAGNAVLARELTGASHVPKIELVVRRDGQVGTLTVQDNGVGMSPVTAARLFENGFSGSPIKGRGIGMGVIQDCFKTQMGGTISFNSIPDVGTVFSISLPMDSSA